MTPWHGVSLRLEAPVRRAGQASGAGKAAS